jgi:hypothetical protein
MAERLQARYEQKQQASSGVVAFKQRQQRRQDYMEQVGQVRELAACLAVPSACLEEMLQHPDLGHNFTTPMKLRL